VTAVMAAIGGAPSVLTNSSRPCADCIPPCARPPCLAPGKICPFMVSAGLLRCPSRRGKSRSAAKLQRRRPPTRRKTKNAGICGRRSQIDYARRDGAVRAGSYWRYCWMRVVRKPARPC
jgi:hypothetical protein